MEFVARFDAIANTDAAGAAAVEGKIFSSAKVPSAPDPYAGATVLLAFQPASKPNPKPTAAAAAEVGHTE